MSSDEKNELFRAYNNLAKELFPYALKNVTPWLNRFAPAIKIQATINIIIPAMLSWSKVAYGLSLVGIVSLMVTSLIDWKSAILLNLLVIGALAFIEEVIRQYRIWNNVLWQIQLPYLLLNLFALRYRVKPLVALAMGRSLFLDVILWVVFGVATAFFGKIINEVRRVNTRNSLQHKALNTDLKAYKGFDELESRIAALFAKGIGQVIIAIDGLPGAGKTIFTKILKEKGITGVSPNEIQLLDRDSFSFIGGSVNNALGHIFCKENFTGKLVVIEGFRSAAYAQLNKATILPARYPHLFVNIVVDENERKRRLLNAPDTHIAPRNIRLSAVVPQPAEFDIIISLTHPIVPPSSGTPPLGESPNRKTLTIRVALEIAKYLRTVGLGAAARAYEVAAEDIRQAIRRWYAMNRMTAPPSVNNIAIAEVVGQEIQEHGAFEHLQNPAFIIYWPQACRTCFA